MDSKKNKKNRNEVFNKEQYIEWGKLGGRPKKETRLTHRITMRLTPDEYDKIKSKSEARGFNFLSNYCRIIVTERELPNFEQDKQLLRYAQNFNLISNFMKMGIFNTEEKNRLISEIETLIAELREKVRWL